MQQGFQLDKEKGTYGNLENLYPLYGLENV